MQQSHLMSLLEAMTNVVVGLLVAVTTQIMVFPILGLHASLGQNLKLALVFTGVSIARSYVLRRFFEALREASHRPGVPSPSACCGRGASSLRPPRNCPQRGPLHQSQIFRPSHSANQPFPLLRGATTLSRLERIKNNFDGHSGERLWQGPKPRHRRICP